MENLHKLYLKNSWSYTNFGVRYFEVHCDEVQSFQTCKVLDLINSHSLIKQANYGYNQEHIKGHKVKEHRVKGSVQLSMQAAKARANNSVTSSSEHRYMLLL